MHRPHLLTCSDGVETWAWSWSLWLTLDGCPTIGLRAYDWPHQVLQTFPHQGVDHFSMDLSLPQDSNKVRRLPADWGGGAGSASGATASHYDDRCEIRSIISPVNHTLFRMQTVQGAAGNVARHAATLRSSRREDNRRHSVPGNNKPSLLSRRRDSLFPRALSSESRRWGQDRNLKMLSFKIKIRPYEASY